MPFARLDAGVDVVVGRYGHIHGVPVVTSEVRAVCRYLDIDVDELCPMRVSERGPHLLGIDIGSSNTNAVLETPSAEIVRTASRARVLSHAYGLRHALEALDDTVGPGRHHPAGLAAGALEPVGGRQT
jgi:hypothetical protein